MSGELKSCPFCGGEAQRYTVLPQPGFENRQVCCKSCGASAYDLKWNRRTTPAPDKLDAATIERLLDPWRRVWMVAFEPFDNGPGEGVGRHAEDAGVADLLPKAWPTIADLRALATEPHQHGGKGA